MALKLKIFGEKRAIPAKCGSEVRGLQRDRRYDVVKLETETGFWHLRLRGDKVAAEKVGAEAYRAGWPGDVGTA